MEYANPASALAQTRTVEESLLALGHLVSRAEGMLVSLHGAITGYQPPGADKAPGAAAAGILHEADYLVGRMQSFVADFERTHLTITSPNVTGLAQQSGVASNARYG